MPGELAEKNGTAIGDVQIVNLDKKQCQQAIGTFNSFSTYFTKLTKLFKVFLQLDTRA